MHKNYSDPTFCVLVIQTLLQNPRLVVRILPEDEPHGEVTIQLLDGNNQVVAQPTAQALKKAITKAFAGA